MCAFLQSQVADKAERSTSFTAVDCHYRRRVVERHIV